MTLSQLQQEQEKKFDEKFPPISACGCSPKHMCQAHAIMGSQGRAKELKSFLHSATQEAYEAGKRDSHPSTEVSKEQ